MRHFPCLGSRDRERLFLHVPEPFAADAERQRLATALGATLYCPATRPRLAQDIARRYAEGVMSMVLCLEDAIPDAEVAEAERNVVTQLRALAQDDVPTPLLFVRVRREEQIETLTRELGPAARLLTGVVLPKFDDQDGKAQLQAVADASRAGGHRLYAMPVIESAEVARVETRVDALLRLRRLLDEFADEVLAVRIGATDLGGQYGLRRSRDHTVYDVALLAAVIGHIVNMLGHTADGYPISGPVWEHFPSSERLFKPLLRETPFEQHHERRLRAELLARDLDGLIREVALDRANGLTGKTVIHPSHVALVHAMSVVSHEEYLDACDVADSAAGGGVSASAYRNKMNESKPHAAWARRTLTRASVFGVARAEVSFVDLLAASMHP